MLRLQQVICSTYHIPLLANLCLTISNRTRSLMNFIAWSHQVLIIKTIKTRVLIIQKLPVKDLPDYQVIYLNVLTDVLAVKVRGPTFSCMKNDPCSVSGYWNGKRYFKHDDPSYMITCNMLGGCKATKVNPPKVADDIVDSYNKSK